MNAARHCARREPSSPKLVRDAREMSSCSKDRANQGVKPEPLIITGFEEFDEEPAERRRESGRVLIGSAEDIYEVGKKVEPNSVGGNDDQER